MAAKNGMSMRTPSLESETAVAATGFKAQGARRDQQSTSSQNAVEVMATTGARVQTNRRSGDQERERVRPPGQPKLDGSSGADVVDGR